KAYVRTRAEGCPKRCARDIKKGHRCFGTAAGADPMGEICFCDFLAADLRDSESDIFHCVRARDYDATALGRRRILVLFIRGSPLADRFFRSSAPNRNLCLRTRTDPRTLGLVDGRTREPVSGWP